MTEKIDKLANCAPNSHISFDGVVVGQNTAGQIVVWFPGLGKSGTWTMPGNIEVETIAPPPSAGTQLQKQAITRQRQLAVESDFGE